MDFEPLDPRTVAACTDERWIPVTGGAIRVLHHCPPDPALRPVVFLPGFSAPVSVWQDAFGMLQGRVEFYVVETLEKGTTRIDGAVPPLHPRDLARQVAAFTDTLGDHVLVATSWLATSVLVGLAEGILTPPTTVACDPLPRFWLPAFIPRWGVTFAPAHLMGALRDPLAAVALWRVEPHEHQRFEDIVHSADPVRWKQAALDGLEVDLCDGRLESVRDEVWIINTADDDVHPAVVMREVAAALPNGHLLQIELGEGRERFCGAVALAFARTPLGFVPDLVAGLGSQRA